MAEENREREPTEPVKDQIISLFNNSPFYRHMGMELLEATQGRSRVRLPLKEEFKNLYGTIHGGAIATLLDSSCSIAAGTLMEPGEVAVTLNQRVNYIAQPQGSLLYAEGRAIHKGRYTGVGQAEVRDDQGNLVAVGTATIFIFRRQQSDD